MYKLVALDLDGTLLKDDGTISSVNKTILQRCMAQGVMVTLCTGRMYSATLPFARELTLNLPLITCHGALVKYADGDLISHFPLAPELAEELFALLHPRQTHIRLYAQDRLYMSDLEPPALSYARHIKVDAHLLPDSIVGMNPTKMAIVDNPERIEAFTELLQQRYGSAIYLTKVNEHFLEISDPHATKGLALANLANQLQITAEEIIAFGDSYNDLPMLHYAGCAVAMGNAVSEVKAVADLIAESNEQDGVGRLLEQLILNH